MEELTGATAPPARRQGIPPGWHEEARRPTWGVRGDGARPAWRAGDLIAPLARGVVGSGTRPAAGETVTSPAPEVPPWTALTIGAVACVLAAALLGAHAQLSVVAAGLGLGAVAAYGVARTRAGLPCAAIAWLGAGGVAGILSWGLGEDYPFGYALAAFQLLVGAVLLPGHLRCSARRPAAGARAGRSGR
jgi:hypothetical protein